MQMVLCSPYPISTIKGIKSKPRFTSKKIQILIALYVIIAVATMICVSHTRGQRPGQRHSVTIFLTHGGHGLLDVKSQGKPRFCK